MTVGLQAGAQARASSGPDIHRAQRRLASLDQAHFGGTVDFFRNALQIAGIGERRATGGVPERKRNARRIGRFTRQLGLANEVHADDVADCLVVRASRELLVARAAVTPAVAAGLVAVAEPVGVDAIGDRLAP